MELEARLIQKNQSIEKPMTATASSEQADVGDQLTEIRTNVLARVWGGLFLLALIGVPVSVSRSLYTGWLPMYGFHLGIGLVVATFYFSSRYMTVRQSAVTVIVLMWAVGTVGIYTLGPLGAGLWWMVCASFIGGVMISARAGWVLITGTAVVVVLAGVGFVSGFITLSVDGNEYVRRAQSWGTLLIAAAILPLIVFRAMAEMTRSIQQLAEQVEQDKQEIARIAYLDDLTGLPSRRLIKDRLQQALKDSAREEKKTAVLFIDLDGFKSVNDEFGHDAGDAVLQAVATRCSERLRGSDTFARNGGDEFVAILKGVSDQDYAEQLARDLIELISNPVLVNGQSVAVGASIGISMNPDHGTTYDSLMKSADQAMYQAKQAGKGAARIAPASGDQ